MNRNEFLAELRQKLAGLPQIEIEKSLAFYAENIDDKIEDGMSEDSAVSTLGNTDSIASEIIREIPTVALVKNRMRVSCTKSNNKTLWLVLAICGFPLWFSLAATVAALVLSAYILIWSLIICLYAVLISFGAVGVGGLVAGIILCITGLPHTGVMLMGMGFIGFGLLFVDIKPVAFLSKKLIWATILILKKIKQLLITQKEETI